MMATGQTYVQCLIFMVLYVLIVQANSSPELVTIDAALTLPNYYKTLILFNEGLALYIPTVLNTDDYFHKEVALVNLTNYELSNISATAAFLMGKNSRDYYLEIYGENKIKSGMDGLEYYDYGSDLEFIKDGGPDAVAKREDKLIYFKGCKMAFRHVSGDWDWEEPEDVKPLALPCHVDAAWDEDNTTIILRGDQIWRWKEDNSVDGPYPFHDIYNITSWILKPYEVSCLDGWHLYDDLNTCYRLIHEKKTWSDARTACQAVGGDLATIKDKGTSDFVNDLVKKDYAYYWMGLNDLQEEGKFVWLDETEEATFTHWLSGEPNDHKGNEDCAHLTWKQFWNDRPCEHKLRYICQVPATRK